MATILALIALTSIVAAEQSYWKYPPNAGGAYDYTSNENLVIGSVVTLKWWSDQPTYNLVMYQQPLDSRQDSSGAAIIQSFSGNGAGDQKYDWNVTTGTRALSASPIFYIETAFANNTRFAGCHYFNITQAQTTTPTQSSSSSITSATASATATVPVSSPANSSATTVGLGVGLGIGIPLLLVAAGFLALKWYKARRSAMPHSAYEAGHAQPAWMTPPSHSTYEAYAKEAPAVIHEAPNTFGPYEVSGGPDK